MSSTIQNVSLKRETSTCSDPDESATYYSVCRLRGGGCCCSKEKRSEDGEDYVKIDEEPPLPSLDRAADEETALVGPQNKFSPPPTISRKSRPRRENSSRSG
jgi:hypothetical protein